ncbi:MAG: hypothetical protein IPN66_07200 [Candidatus Competibacteraceae bacterium]|jgi:antitoxin component of RelBE/YafQ-DinJ toxin-antitoxin module|nr:hypothetical protein [Candidatus Competibacteraceae bacterium]MBK8897003.1 hypothetical protein [Candidatus Competibacteraceae bacterium]
MPKLKDSQLAANVRNRTKEATRKMRERYQAMGHVTLTVWVSTEAKEKAEKLAKNRGVKLGEVVDLALQRLDENEMDATAHLMSSPANAARLMEAINDHRAGRNMRERELMPDDD